METFVKWVRTLPLAKEWFRQASMDAFEKAHADLMDTRADDLEKRAEELSQEKFAKLLTTIDEKEILTLDTRTKQLLIGGEVVDIARLSNLKAEADFLTQSEIWKILNATPQKLAEKAMFVADGDVQTQLLKGRSILYTLDSQRRAVELIQGLSTAP